LLVSLERVKVGELVWEAGPRRKGFVELPVFRGRTSTAELSLRVAEEGGDG
jgi:hypothetical protein